MGAVTEPVGSFSGCPAWITCVSNCQVMSSSSGAWPDAVVLHGWSVGGSRVENAKRDYALAPGRRITIRPMKVAMRDMWMRRLLVSVAACQPDTLGFRFEAPEQLAHGGDDLPALDDGP